MSGYFYQYITVVVRDFIFFHDDVQSTTIAVAIASSLCCSIVWAICHLLTLGSSSASCGEYIADYTCRFVTCKICCLAPSSCTTHQAAEKRRRPYRIPRNGVTEINLRSNSIQHMPASLYKLKNLKVLKFEKNKIDSLSGAVSNLLDLEDLNLSHCQLSAIPRELGSCCALRKVDISHNRITDLPAHFGQLRELTRLNLSGNNLRPKAKRK
uniref:Leucine-rich repeat protein soc-2-like protein n=1 Tax=Magallana gigas TaxID=29159 RepID=K1PI13_MAGGI